MMTTNKAKLEGNDWGSMNPKDDTFNFDLWAKQVRLQMIETLEKKLGEKILTS